MGGILGWKVLWDYHKKIENSLNRYSKGETQLLNSILGEIEVYNAIEEEVFFPALENIAPAEVEAAQERLDHMKELLADIENLEPGDPEEARLMKRLQKAWSIHTAREEKVLFPIMKTNLKDELYEMARQSFAVRQELLAAREGRSSPGQQYYIGIPTSGWGKGANRGW